MTPDHHHLPRGKEDINCLTKRNSYTYMMLIHTNSQDRSLSSCITGHRGHGVRYEAAGSLVTLSSSPTELIFKEGDDKIIQKMVIEIVPVPEIWRSGGRR